MIQKSLPLLAASSAAIMLLTACNPFNSTEGKVKKVIAEGLAKDAPCMSLPIGVAAAPGRTYPAIDLLRKSGDVKDGKVDVISFFSNKKDAADGVVFTEQGQKLLKNRERLDGSACVFTGKFQPTKIEAVDISKTASGSTIAQVRARIEFVPESWLAPSRGNQDWADYWKGIDETASHQFIYSLLKSGDDFFYTGRGEIIK